MHAFDKISQENGILQYSHSQYTTACIATTTHTMGTALNIALSLVWLLREGYPMPPLDKHTNGNKCGHKYVHNKAYQQASGSTILIGKDILLVLLVLEFRWFVQGTN